MRLMIQHFLKSIEKEKNQNEVKILRRMQLFINKIFHNLEFIDVTHLSQNYVLHSISMLYEILSNPKMMAHKEIKLIFYTEKATNMILSLIIKEYTYTSCAAKIRQLVYAILIKLMEIDTKASRESFRIWTHYEDNKSRLFGRITDLCVQFSAYFIKDG